VASVATTGTVMSNTALNTAAGPEAGSSAPAGIDALFALLMQATPAEAGTAPGSAVEPADADGGNTPGAQTGEAVAAGNDNGNGAPVSLTSLTSLTLSSDTAGLVAMLQSAANGQIPARAPDPQAAANDAVTVQPVANERDGETTDSAQALTAADLAAALIPPPAMPAPVEMAAAPQDGAADAAETADAATATGNSAPDSSTGTASPLPATAATGTYISGTDTVAAPPPLDRGEHAPAPAGTQGTASDDALAPAIADSTTAAATQSATGDATDGDPVQSPDSANQPSGKSTATPVFQPLKLKQVKLAAVQNAGSAKTAAQSTSSASNATAASGDSAPDADSGKPAIRTKSANDDTANANAAAATAATPDMTPAVPVAAVTVAIASAAADTAGADGAEDQPASAASAAGKSAPGGKSQHGDSDAPLTGAAGKSTAPSQAGANAIAGGQTAGTDGASDGDFAASLKAATSNGKAAQSDAAQPAQDAPQPVTVADASATTAASAATAAQQQAAATHVQTVAVKIKVGSSRDTDDTAATSKLDSLSLSVAAKSAAGLRHFDIRLDPPELGRVEVRLSVDDSGSGQVTMIADKPHTLALLQRDADGLARSLSEAGVDLTGGGLSFSLRSDQNSQNGNNGKQDGGSELAVEAVADTGPVAAGDTALGLTPDGVHLDIRV
jgi:flagellar hook-length control protein FliK